MEPVALSQLVKQAPEGAPFAAGADGTLEIRTALPCAAYPFFAPFPFFCLGCCHFRASALTFDDRTRRFQYRSWPGLLRCCARTGDFAYEDIGNVATYSWNFSSVRGVSTGTFTIDGGNNTVLVSSMPVSGKTV